MAISSCRAQIHEVVGKPSKLQPRASSLAHNLRGNQKQTFYGLDKTPLSNNERKTFVKDSLSQTATLASSILFNSQNNRNEELKIELPMRSLNINGNLSINIENNSYLNENQNKSQYGSIQPKFNSNKIYLPPIQNLNNSKLLGEKKNKGEPVDRNPIMSLAIDPEKQKMERFFRGKLSSLINGAGKKQYYMKFLTTMKDLQTKIKVFQKAQATGNEGISEIVKKLKKIVATRSKFRYREKLDFERAIVLRTLGYEARQLVNQMRENQKGEYDDLEDEGDKEQEELDKQKLERGIRKDNVSAEMLANWKKYQKINEKVFIIVGSYPDLKNTLKSCGWVENTNKDSLMFDLKWVTKKKDVDKDILIESQITNHFYKNQCLTAKHGLALSLKNLIYFDDIDIDTFYPRCYDLSDVQDFEDFLEEFKFSHAESILKLYTKGELVISNQAKQYEKYTRLKILIACSLIKRRTFPIEQKVLKITNNILPIATPDEWYVLNRNDNNFNHLEQNQDTFSKLQQKISKELDSEEMDAPDLNIVCEKYLNLSKQYDPQYKLNKNNSWIIKPGGLSRGRGIRSFDDLEHIINYIVGKDVMWVAQKYIENPLTINNKKFDIRQWVLVAEWNPLTIYFYDTCYIRVCFEEYNPDDLQNKFAHLANNCISKNAENFEERAEDTMMHLEEFVDYIKLKENGKDFYHAQIQKQMKKIVINSIKSCKDSIEQRKNSFELYGYDFMIDNEYNPWLIEVNSSPSMEYSTVKKYFQQFKIIRRDILNEKFKFVIFDQSVTTKLVKMCMEDTAKLINDFFCKQEKRFRREQEFGLWKNIWRDNK